MSYGMAGDKVPSGYKQGQLQNFTPEQMKLLQQLMNQIGPDSYTSRLAGGDQSLFDEMEAPAKRQFQGFLGNLASRFSGVGLGARKSSGFYNTANSAASQFAQELQANRQNLQRQAIGDIQSYGTNLLNQKPYDRFLVPKQQKQGFDWGSFASKAIPAALGFFGGGPAGSAAATGGADFLKQMAYNTRG